MSISSKIFSSIERGLVLLVGISQTDGPKDIEYLVNKITNMRSLAEEINIGIDSFGESAPGGEVANHFGIKPERVAEKIQKRLN